MFLVALAYLVRRWRAGRANWLFVGLGAMALGDGRLDVVEKVTENKSAQSHNVSAGAAADATTGAATGATADEEIIAHDVGADAAADATAGAATDATTDEENNGKQRQKMLDFISKAKIVLGLYQIIGSMQWSLPAVLFPKLLQAPFSIIANWFNFSVLSIVPVECFRRVSYYDSLLFTTLTPFVAFLIIVLVSLLRVWRTTDAEAKDNAHSTMYYILMLYIFIILPGCASTSFRYFGCSDYEMGVYAEKIAVLDIDPNIICNVKHYDKWMPYVVLMIIIYPIGVPLTSYAMLWRMRDMLDPPVDVAEEREGTHGRSMNAGVVFAADQKYHAMVLQQTMKMEIRETKYKREIQPVLFLVEEYEPRCYWFATFECLRRILMTGGLTIFDSEGPIRVAVGLTIAMISYRIYSFYRPYISDDNDTISEVAQTQLVIFFFAALMLFVQAGEGNESGLAISIFNISLFLTFFAGLAVAIYIVLAEAVGKDLLNALGASLIERIYNLLCIKVTATKVPTLDGNQAFFYENTALESVTLNFTDPEFPYESRRLPPPQYPECIVDIRLTTMQA